MAVVYKAKELTPKDLPNTISIFVINLRHLYKRIKYLIVFWKYEKSNTFMTSLWVSILEFKLLKSAQNKYAVLAKTKKKTGKYLNTCVFPRKNKCYSSFV